MVRVIIGAAAAAVVMLIIGFIFFATPLARLGMAGLDDAQGGRGPAIARRQPAAHRHLFGACTDTPAQTNMFSQADRDGPLQYERLRGQRSDDVRLGLVFNFIVALLIGRR